MNVLITGGAGFIGSHTYVALVEAGHRPIVLDDFSNASPSVLDALAGICQGPVGFYQGNIDDAALLDRIFQNESIDGIIHFAAFKAVGESTEQPLKYYRNNVAASITLLEKCLEHGVQSLVFSSSCTVYGQAKDLPVSEDAPIQVANSPYGNTKQIGEEMMRDLVLSKAPIKIMALRYFNPIGAHPSAAIGELPNGIPSNLIPFLTQSVAGLRGPLQVFGNDYPTPDGTAIRDYIHVMDLAEAHVQALDHLSQIKESTHFDCINIGTGDGKSVLQVIQAFEKATGEKVPYEIKSRRAGDITAIYAATDKSKKVLNWQTKRSLEEALRDAWNWQLHLKSQASV